MHSMISMTVVILAGLSLPANPPWRNSGEIQFGVTSRRAGRTTCSKGDIRRGSSGEGGTAPPCVDSAKQRETYAAFFLKSPASFANPMIPTVLSSRTRESEHHVNTTKKHKNKNRPHRKNYKPFRTMFQGMHAASSSRSPAGPPPRRKTGRIPSSSRGDEPR